MKWRTIRTSSTTRIVWAPARGVERIGLSGISRGWNRVSEFPGEGIPQVQYTPRQHSGAVRVVTASLAGLTVDAAGRLGAAERSAHARENAVESDPAGEDDQSHSELGDRAEIPRPFNRIGPQEQEEGPYLVG